MCNPAADFAMGAAVASCVWIAALLVLIVASARVFGWAVRSARRIWDGRG